MAHQLLLCSGISHDNYIQTVSTLQALTGVLCPQEIATYTLLTKPHNVFKPKFEPGKVNQIEQYYMKCCTTWTDDAAKSLNLQHPVLKSLEILVDRLFTGKEVKHWTLQISDIPNAGKNPVLAHNFYESTLVHHHTTKKNREVESAIPKTEDSEEANGGVISIEDVDMDAAEDNAPKEPTVMTSTPEAKDSFLQFVEDLGYDVVNQYWLKGIRFFHGDIVIEIFKVLVRDDDVTLPTETSKLPLKLLDDSNAFQIKAYINYPKGASVDIINSGTKELTKLKESLNNLFELEVPDRMFMDSRVSRNR